MEETKTKKTFMESLKERLNFSDWDRKTWIYVIVFLLLMILSLIIGYLWARDNDIFYEWMIKYFVRPIGNLRFWGIVLFLFFMVLQSALMPIPSAVMVLAGGIVWGFTGGFILGMIGSIFSAAFSYIIAARGGAPIVEKALGKDKIEAVDVYLQKYGGPFVFTMRAIPFVSFDVISYVSGLMKIDFKKYMYASTFGSITRCLFFAWAGNEITGGNLDELLAMNEEEIDAFISAGAGDFNRIVIIILGTLILFAILYNYVLLPYLVKKRADEIKRMDIEEKKKLEEQTGIKINEEQSSDLEDNTSLREES